MKVFYIRFGIALTAICFFINLNLKAQNVSFTTEHLKAAEDLLNATDEKAKLETSLKTAVKLQGMRVPENKRAAFEEVMLAFTTKYITWELLSEKMSALYAEEFTTEELKQLTIFYKTPTGKKYAAKLPKILLKTEQVGQQLTLAHQEEFKAMLQKAFAKN
ncbi:MAG: DUF2059 domain-containing protein [Janthinobacterium lividum]